MATGTRGSARGSRRGPTRHEPGWLIVGVTAVVSLLWFGVLAFGLPGQRSAVASPSGSGTGSAAGSSTGQPHSRSAAGQVRTHAGAASTTSSAAPTATTSPAPPTTSRTSATTGAHQQPTPGADPSVSAPAIDRPGEPSSPTRSVKAAEPARTVQEECPSTAERQVQELAPGNAGPLTVALTFDDGPGDATPEVLDILAREHVHATFFVIGHEVAAHPGLVRRASQEGHLIGNHTYDHVYPRDLPGGWTSRYLSGQLRSTAAAVYRETGLPTCFFRPPGGFMPGSVLPNARKLRMTTSLWSIDTRDWAVQGPHAPAASRVELQARVIASRAVSGGRPPAHPIVLFHDGGGFRGSTATALTRVIRWYKGHGYTFVRLDGRV